MNTTLLLILAVFVSWAAAFYYLYIVKGWYDWGYAGRATLLVIFTILIPLVVVALGYQSQAKQHLAEQGFAVHGEIGSSIGIATGHGISNNSWVFEFTGQGSAFAAFYRDPSNRTGWQLTSDNGVMLVFRKDAKRMTISAGNGTAIFVLSEDPPS